MRVVGAHRNSRSRPVVFRIVRVLVVTYYGRHRCLSPIPSPRFASSSFARRCKKERRVPPGCAHPLFEGSDRVGHRPSEGDFHNHHTVICGYLSHSFGNPSPAASFAKGKRLRRDVRSQRSRVGLSHGGTIGHSLHTGRSPRCRATWPNWLSPRFPLRLWTGPPVLENCVSGGGDCCGRSKYCGTGLL